MSDQPAENVQPESPKHEGVDPLTEGGTLYPREDTKTESEAQSEKDNAARTDEDVAASDRTEQTVADQTALKAEGQTPAGVNDGSLPADAQTANHVGSDAENTSPSNKPATPSEPTTPATDGLKAE